MTEFDEDTKETLTRPSLDQVNAVVEFMQNHKELVHRKSRSGLGHGQVKKLWTDLTTTVNSMEGSIKSTKSWIKFWSDTRRNVLMKQKQIALGNSVELFSPLEQKILDLCEEKFYIPRRKGIVKKEECNGDDDSSGAVFSEEDDLALSQYDTSNQLFSANIEQRQLSMLEKLVDIMNQQSEAMDQMAQISDSNAKAMEVLADSTIMQAMAVDKMATTFETMTRPMQEVRDAIISIDYTLKRCYNAQHRQNNDKPTNKQKFQNSDSNPLQFYYIPIDRLSAIWKNQPL